MSFEFTRITPEEVGLPSRAVIDFLDLLERRGVEMHSFMILRHGKVCAEGWWEPYSPERKHPVFSFGKSITSTAIGFAEQEGILSIDEKLIDIFSDILPDDPSENLKKVTLRHLLSMSCGHEVEPYAHAEDWMKRFLAHPFLHEPGTMFQYNNTGTNMLVAALKRKTGLELTEFLRPRLFEPLGISDFSCAFRNGIDNGAFGFSLTTDGMARFAQFVLQRGMWNGKRLLDESWFDRATSKQIETVGGVYDGKRDWGAGYCYQYWRFERDDEAFRCDGACGQFGIILPKQDSVIITTAGTGLTQQMIDCVWETIIPAMTDHPLPEDRDAVLILNERTKRLRIAPLFPGRAQESEKKVGGRSFKAQQETPGVKALLGGFGPNMGFGDRTDSIAFGFNESDLDLKLVQGDRESVIKIGLEGRFAIAPAGGDTYAGVGRWRSPYTFEAEIRDLGSVSGSRLLFRFDDDKLELSIEPTIFMYGGPDRGKPPVYLFKAE